MNRVKRKPRLMKKWKLFPFSWKYQTKEFFQKSTLHGIRYIAQADRPFYERLMWLVLTAMGSSITLMIILSLWRKFQTNPTITGLDTDFHNWDVPFPAVTICPNSAMNETIVDQYIIRKWGSNQTAKDMDYYRNMITVVSQLSYNNFNGIKQFVNDKSVTLEDLQNILPQVQIRCEDLLYDCQWKELDYKCCDEFLPMRTENGFCYSFNSLLAQQNSLKISPQVQHIYETDSKWSLMFGLKSDERNHVKIYIHSSEEAPSIDMDPQLIWTNQISKIFFSSKHTYTTDDARQLSIQQRRCIFADERKLITHTRYSYTSCMIQCRMETSMNLCGCVPNFYKKIDGFTFCSLEGLGCLLSHLHKLDRSMPCGCELGCENTVYEVEKLVDAVQDNERLEVGFVSWPMVRYKREVLFGWVDLLVSFGGIAGLFLGFSLLTGVEILYYFTMRTVFMVYHNTDELLKAVQSDTEHEKRKEKLKLETNRSSYTNQVKNNEIFTLPFLN